MKISYKEYNVFIVHTFSCSFVVKTEVDAILFEGNLKSSVAKSRGNRIHKMTLKIHPCLYTDTQREKCTFDREIEKYTRKY